jgi:hypothetical protein
MVEGTIALFLWCTTKISPGRREKLAEKTMGQKEGAND